MCHERFEEHADLRRDEATMRVDGEHAELWQRPVEQNRFQESGIEVPRVMTLGATASPMPRGAAAIKASPWLLIITAVTLTRTSRRPGCVRVCRKSN
jgi:hypothetical protein